MTWGWRHYVIGVPQKCEFCTRRYRVFSPPKKPRQLCTSTCALLDALCRVVDAAIAKAQAQQ